MFCVRFFYFSINFLKEKIAYLGKRAISEYFGETIAQYKGLLDANSADLSALALRVQLFRVERSLRALLRLVLSLFDQPFLRIGL